MSYLLLLILSLAGTSSESLDPPINSGLAIFCVEAERRDGRLLRLDELVLKKTAYLTEDQIESYDWDSHTISVVPGSLRDRPEAQQFVLMVDDLRIYRGYFTHVISSRGYFGSLVVDLPFLTRPDGDIAPLRGRENQIQIKMWANEDGDPRFDKRLYDYLESAQLLSHGE